MVPTLQSRCLQTVKYLSAALILACWNAVAVQAESVTIFAAASLRDAAQDLSAQYAVQTGDEPVLVFAATSAIARQVAQGAPADVVLLADQDWADWLVGQADDWKTAPFAGNSLVLVSGGEIKIDNIDELPATLGFDVLAMAQVETVPAGRYGKAALENAGLWDSLSPQIVQAANVRAALRFVERGEAPFGIGYASDLVALPELNEVYRFAPDSHPPIIYVAAHGTPEGADFMTFLQSDSAQGILQTWGFLTVADLP